MRKRSTLFALMAVLALVVAACGSDAADETTTTEALESTTTTEAEVMEDEDMDDDMGTIVDVASASEDFTTLVAAVQAAGLVDTLNGEGPFTVFAPTDEAFEAALVALNMTADELLADTETLTSILTYHVLPLEAPAETVLGLDGENVATVNGATVLVTIDGDTVMVNEANVLQTDIFASNGVIHVIDAVLLPPAS